MDRFEGMRIFRAVADARSFAQAARQLGLSAPAVSRAVVALEEHVGAQLLRRTTRSVTLTDVGERFHADCVRILAEVAEAEAAAGGAHATAHGELTVTAPRMFGRLHLAPVIAGFLAAEPGITVRALFADHILHLLEESFDVALRIATLPDSGMTAVRVGHVRRVVVASPAYLREHGVPRTPGDLDDHATIAYALSGSASAPWDFHPSGRKARMAVAPKARFTTNSNETAIAAALAGHGLAKVLSYQVAADVAAGRLRIVLAAHEPPPLPVQLVHAGGRRPPAKVKAFVEFAAARLRREPVLSGKFAWPEEE